MNIKRGSWAVLAVFIFTMVWGGFYHLVLLKGADLEIRQLYRPDMAGKMWLSVFGVLGISILFVIGYSLCSRRGTLLEGMAYGVCFSVLAFLLVDLNQYILYPIPFMLILKWYIGGLIEFIVNGLLVSLLYPVRKG